MERYEILKQYPFCYRQGESLTTMEHFQGCGTLVSLELINLSTGPHGSARKYIFCNVGQFYIQLIVCVCVCVCLAGLIQTGPEGMCHSKL